MMRGRAKSATLGAKNKPSPPPPLDPIAEIPSVPAKKFSALDIGGAPKPEKAEWEVRPGGMLVQKRDPDSDLAAPPPPPPIRVRVKFGSVYHEIRISPQASFGELKKLLSAQIGLHPQDQKILFKDKEKESSAFLDISGVKDRSKMVLLEDPAGQAKRCLEMMKNAKMEKAAKSISQISAEVDRLASQVSALESIIAKGKKVSENDVLGLIEQLMNQLLKLDGIMVDGDAKLQRRMQVKRVQKCVETLDVLKVKNAMSSENIHVAPLQQDYNHRHQQQQQQKQSRNHQQLLQKSSPQPPVVVTKKWEPFDLLSSMPSTSSASSATIAASTTTTTTRASPAPTHTPRFDWELF